MSILFYYAKVSSCRYDFAAAKGEHVGCALPGVQLVPLDEKSLPGLFLRLLPVDYQFSADANVFRRILLDENDNRFRRQAVRFRGGLLSSWTRILFLSTSFKTGPSIWIVGMCTPFSAVFITREPAAWGVTLVHWFSGRTMY